MGHGILWSLGSYSYLLLQILMNVQMTSTPVTLMPHAKTFLETLPASVTKDTVEMDLSAMVIRVV